MPRTAIHTQLQDAIAGAALDLYLIPMVDEFQSEYIPPYAARLPFISGFTGSAGLLAFWAKPGELRQHTLFTDGRYTLQAAKEVEGSGITVLNSGDTPLLDWLEARGEGLKIGLDPWLITQSQWEGWQKASAAYGAQWVAHSPNLIDGIWADQPPPPAGDVHLHPIEFAGTTYAEKRDAILATLKKNKADSVLLSQPDGINWLLNIRGTDVDFNPLLLAHMVLRADGSSTLFMHPHALSEYVADYFKSQHVTVEPLADVFTGNVKKNVFGAVAMMDTSVTATGWFSLAEKLGVTIQRAEDPSVLPKACKNAVELNGIRAAHVRDGLALSRFLHWFDTQSGNGNYPDELGVVSKIEEFRSAGENHRGASFATIAGSGGNGAIVHYRADEQSNRKSRVGELFLIDSGGQYLDGTTDVTRTLFVSGPSGGTPAPAMKEHYTRVLKGHIALGSAKFPVGTSGIQLDVLARQFLWEAGLDFDHGTGHGVGAYLCVHEGPQRISKRGSLTPLQPGMILSNEPGYYAAGQYGIRIESLVVVVDAGKSADGKQLLAFETLTLAPIDTRLVEISMLTATERNWLNAYHRRVYETHASQLDEKTRNWLMKATRAI